jgi:hypothetical protein
MAALPRLLELTTLDGETYVYDQNKVAALFMMGRFFENQSAIVLHVLGLGAVPLAIGGTADALLATFDTTIRAQFIHVDGPEGPAVVKATAVSFLLPKVPGDEAPGVNCAIYFAANQYLKVSQAVATVRDLINGVRLKMPLQYEFNTLIS